MVRRHFGDGEHFGHAVERKIRMAGKNGAPGPIQENILDLRVTAPIVFVIANRIVHWPGFMRRRDREFALPSVTR